MERYPYLLFDADDTLFDFQRNGQRAFTMLCAKYNFPCSEESHAVFETFNQPLWRALEQGTITKEFLKVERFRLFLDHYRRKEDPAAVNRDFLSFLGTGSFLVPGAEETCRRLSRTHRLFILTNSVEAVHTNRMRQSLLMPYIEGSFVSETAGYEKPDKRFFDHVFSRIPGITKSNCLLIGDSLTSDIQGGVNAGIPVCWFNPHRLEKPAAPPIDYMIHDLSELPPLLDGGQRT